MVALQAVAQLRGECVPLDEPGALPQGAFEQVVEKAKSLDMDEVRKQIAEEDKKTGTA